MPGQPRRTTRLSRSLGLDGNPLRRTSDRVEAWIRVGLLAVFLIAGPLVALGAGHWAYHAGIAGARVSAAQSHHVEAAGLPPALIGADPAQADGGRQAWARARAGAGVPAHVGTSPRADEVLTVVMTLALMALALLVALRLTLVFLRRRRLAAWEMAWSRVGPQWSRGRF